MSERVDGFADQFERACSDFLTKVNALSESQWAEPLINDSRPAGVVAHHVATGYEATTGVLMALLAGVDLGLSMDVVHGANADHAAAHHAVTKDETLALLQSNGAKALAILRGLSDAQLDQPVIFPLFGDGPMPAQVVIQGLIIGHISSHGADLSA